ncbi:OmpA family protein [Labedaea rhizosphaerae]|uniref:Outer membrane protein OmpA-like peptidoglycan-associated protein n=1 Tax=Labedaea rhizosphaerae TaxID=598644 RepID=A0A4V3CY58_LABRH|nr:outer membrane protein OmpA-like peptidoglycan-associated protein [Labedaea rhizosphaerae]
MKHWGRSATRALVVAALFASAGLGTAACGNDHPKPCPTGPAPQGLAIAVGDRSNSAKPNWPSVLDADVDAITKTSGKGVTIIRADGTPTIGCVLTYVPTANNDTANTHNRTNFVDAVHVLTTGMHAAARESNPLAALGLASSSAGPNGIVALIDSGLQTMAPLDFRKNNLLDRNPKSVVAALVKTGELPDLHGRTVVLAGIGWTSAPQAQLSDSQRGHLIELWQLIVKAAGARAVVSVPTPSTTPADVGLPEVSPVPIPPPDDLVIGCDKELVLQDDGAVGFVADKTEFRDRTAARTKLAKVADWLRDNPDATGTITGSIAHYGADDPNGLSLDRAAQVRATLVELGAGATQLIAKGRGWGPFPTDTAPPDGNSDVLNRRVVVSLSCG